MRYRLLFFILRSELLTVTSRSFKSYASRSDWVTIARAMNIRQPSNVYEQKDSFLTNGRLSPFRRVSLTQTCARRSCNDVRRFAKSSNTRSMFGLFPSCCGCYLASLRQGADRSDSCIPCTLLLPVYHRKHVWWTALLRLCPCASAATFLFTCTICCLLYSCSNCVEYYVFRVLGKRACYRFLYSSLKGEPGEA